MKKKDRVEKLIKDNEDLHKKVHGLTKDVEGYLSLESELSKSLGVSDRRNISNYRIESILFDRLRLFLYTMFEYVGLPDYIPSWIIEKVLFDSGEALFWETGGKFFVGHYVKDGKIDEYRRPIGVYPKYLNGKSGSIRTIGENAVIIRNTFTSYPTYKTMLPFVGRLTKNFEALTQKLHASMTKWAMIVDKPNKANVKASLERLMDENGYIAYLPSDGMLKLEQIPFFEEFNGSEYWEDFNSTISLMYNQLGINTNPNEDKKERLLVDEININEQRVGLILESMIRSRLESIREINNIFGLNIGLKVKIKEVESEEDDINDTHENDPL